MTFSDIGNRLSGPSGIQELMDDLGEALTVNPDMLMLGGGQPAGIPSVQAMWRREVEAMLHDGMALDRMLLNYDPPGGNPKFREDFAGFLQRECGWAVDVSNIGILPSSQNAFFLLFNLLAGKTSEGWKKILFPLMPEYIGYANQGLFEGMFTGQPAVITEHSAHEFKYGVDFDQLKITPDIAAMCVSCPTNPTGNVLTQEEFDRLRDLAREHGIPFILDNAYGHPFPGVIHTGFTPKWEPGMIFSISLSKVGLPGARTSIIVADPELITALARMNANTSLANGNLGQAILRPLLRNDSLLRMSQDVIRPFYKKQAEFAVQALTHELGEVVQWSLHAQDGAFFLWLWIKDLKVRSAELYQRLKKRNVLVISGHYFFYGLSEPWEHQHQCIRISVGQSEAVMQRGIEIVADEIKRCCG